MDNKKIITKETTLQILKIILEEQNGYSKKQRQYRIVKKYQSFFCHWKYELQVKIEHKNALFRYLFGDCSWHKVAGNELTTEIPSDWEDLTSEIIELQIGD